MSLQTAAQAIIDSAAEDDVRWAHKNGPVFTTNNIPRKLIETLRAELALLTDEPQKATWRIVNTLQDYYVCDEHRPQTMYESVAWQGNAPCYVCQQNIFHRRMNLGY